MTNEELFLAVVKFVAVSHSDQPSLLELVWFCKKFEKGPMVTVAAVSWWALVDAALEVQSAVVMSALARFAQQGEVGNRVGKY